MTKTNKIRTFLTVTFVIATVAEIILCLSNAKTFDWLPCCAIFSALTVAFSSLDRKKASEKNK